MRVDNISIATSPLSSDRTCVRAEVICEDRMMPAETYWIDVPNRYSDCLNDSGNAWLALLLPLAVHLGEPLEISKPVDRDLFINVHELMRVWNCWYPQLNPVRIVADIADAGIRGSSDATGAFFSGGVDAWFTFLTHEDGLNAGAFPIDYLLCVWGLDVRLTNHEGYRALNDALGRATAESDTQLIDVATNIRDTRWWNTADWGPVAHGSGLAAIGHALSGMCARVLIPASHRYDDDVPWGSHPLADPLLSSSLTRIIHDGAGFNRVQKMEEVIKSQAALDSLQVCWASGHYDNCGVCPKCVRTLTTLYLLDALDRCPRFTESTIDIKSLARSIPLDESSATYLREVQQLAVSRGKHEIAHAISKSLKLGRRVQRNIRLADLLLHNAPNLDRRIKRMGRRMMMRNPHS